LQVHHALLYSISGTFQLPSDKKGAEFSRNNWDDYTFYTKATPAAPNTVHQVKRASTFLKAISGLQDQQWKDIFNVALSFQATGKPRRSVKEDVQPVSETDSDEDDELVDPRYAMKV
jgi:hypothetical protein